MPPQHEQTRSLAPGCHAALPAPEPFIPGRPEVLQLALDAGRLFEKAMVSVIRPLREAHGEIQARREAAQVLSLVQLIIEGTRASAEDVYKISGFLKASDLMEICDRVNDRSLHYPGFNPRLPKPSPPPTTSSP
jgi:hypothetical protein